MTPNPNICIRCGGQANILFSEKIYRYSIAPDNVIKQIFMPIEIVNNN